MKSPRPHEKLDVWKRAITLSVDIYKATEGLPPDEKYGLSSQMRRAAVSVGSNIAEGAAGGSPALYVRSLRIARASLAELDTQLEICRRLTYISDSECEHLGEQTEIIGKMITNLIKALKKK